MSARTSESCSFRKIKGTSTKHGHDHKLWFVALEKLLFTTLNGDPAKKVRYLNNNGGFCYAGVRFYMIVVQ